MVKNLSWAMQGHPKAAVTLCVAEQDRAGEEHLLPDSDVRLHVEIHHKDFTSSFFRAVNFLFSLLLTFFSGISACFAKIIRGIQILGSLGLSWRAKQNSSELKPILYVESLCRKGVQAT